MLREYLGQKVVIDCRSEYICLGTLSAIDDHFVEVKNADMHDLRDTDTNRENYLAQSVCTGVKRNRKRVLLFRTEIVAISLLSDIVDS